MKGLFVPNRILKEYRARPLRGRGDLPIDWISQQAFDLNLSIVLVYLLSSVVSVESMENLDGQIQPSEIWNDTPRSL
jgi:hypothetical protein